MQEPVDIDPVADVLVRLGGIADAASLLAATSRHRLRQALASGKVIRLGRGRYAVPELAEHPRAASGLSGSLDLVSAAMHHGWKVLRPPPQPQVVVPRGRNVPAHRRTGIDVRWGEVTPAELRAGVITPVRTVLDAARFLPYDQALAITDSALRAGLGRSTLLLSAQLPRTGRSRAFAVVESATALAANPFESALRAILEDVPGTDFRPQVWVGNVGRADLVDVRRRIVVEADSFEFHSDTAALARDIERYNAFVAEDHTLLRFAWRHAMFEAEYVRTVVSAVVSAQERSVRGCDRCRAA